MKVGEEVLGHLEVNPKGLTKRKNRDFLKFFLKSFEILFFNILGNLY